MNRFGSTVAGLWVDEADRAMLDEEHAPRRLIAMEEVLPATTGLVDEPAGDQFLLLRRQVVNQCFTGLI